MRKEYIDDSKHVHINNPCKQRVTGMSQAAYEQFAPWQMVMGTTVGDCNFITVSTCTFNPCKQLVSGMSQAAYELCLPWPMVMDTAVGDSQAVRLEAPPLEGGPQEVHQVHLHMQQQAEQH